MKPFPFFIISSIGKFKHNVRQKMVDIYWYDIKNQSICMRHILGLMKSSFGMSSNPKENSSLSLFFHCEINFSE